jgi:molybdopterin synthase sulfurtransferase
VCVRSPAEHEGESSGYTTISARGRIRGSVWGRAGSDKDTVEALERPDGTLRDLDELAVEWSKHDVDPDDRVVFYCGTGWRASLALFQAWRLGWERVSLYDPGWFEWGADPSNNPIESGPVR